MGIYVGKSGSVMKGIHSLNVALQCRHSSISPPSFRRLFIFLSTRRYSVRLSVPRTAAVRERRVLAEETCCTIVDGSSLSSYLHLTLLSR